MSLSRGSPRERRELRSRFALTSWNEDTFDYDWVTLGKPAIRANYDAILAKQANGTYNDAGIIVLTHEM